MPGPARSRKGKSTDATDGVAEALRAAIDDLDELFLLCDAGDRIVMFNRRWEAASPGETTIGQTFEDFLREGAARGRIAEAAGREEAWIANRLAARRAGTIIERKIGDHWYQLKDHPVAGGGVATVGIEITERKRVEQALAESEARFRSFAETGSDWIWETDAEDRYTWFGGAIERQVGRPAAHYLGRTRTEVAIAADVDVSAEPWKSHMEAVARHEPFRDMRQRRVTHQGVIWLSMSGAPRFDAGGRFLGYRAAVTNITALVASEQRAQESSGRLREAIDDLNESIALTDGEDRIVVTNKRFRENNAEVAPFIQPGRLFEEHLRERIRLGHFPEALGREEAWLEERRAQRRNPGGPVERQRQDGSWLRITDQRLPGGGTITYGLDITERVEAERKAQAAREQLRSALENLGEMICLTDAEDRIVLANRLFIEFNKPVAGCLEQGRRYDEHLRAGIALGLFPDAAGRTEEWIAERLSARRNPQGSVERRRQDGRWLMVDDQLLPDGGIITYGIEITERKRAEEALLNINADLERRVAERTAALETAYRELESFSYSVSHDLRSPLGVIASFAGILARQESGRISEDGMRLVSVIDENAQRMGRLIDALLELMRMSRQALVHRELDMARIAGATCRELQRAYPKARVLLGNLPQALGDEILVQQVYANLVGNALKFSSKQASPLVEVGAETGVGPGAGAPVYYIRDNGAGFDAVHAAKLFKPFERLHSEEEFPGTGIGLALVTLIVQRHGGRIWAESAPGKGSTFRFTLIGSGPG